MEKYTLKNGIKTTIKKNNNTPRAAVVLYAGINNDEKKSGLFYLMTQLLFQGTKNRTSEQLATELDENAIELSIEKRADFVRFKLLCLNEDLDIALEIFEDIIENSTFDEIEKEIVKIKGEFEADLDSPRIQAQDNYYRTIYKNHAYGTGRKEILNEIDSVTKDDLINAFNEIKYTVQKNISVVSDIENDKVIKLLEKHFSGLRTDQAANNRKNAAPLKENSVSVIAKEDANQAQIFQGWLFPSLLCKEYPAILLLNTILGSSGLSSRLFLELREKQGLAYTVRSSYESYLLGGNFSVYIATEPNNIKTCLEGFKREINKIMTELITGEELKNAKSNTIGKRKFYRQTNLLEATLDGYYEFLSLGCEFEELLIDNIKSATAEDIINTAKKYFDTPYALSVLAPSENLKNAELL